VVGGKGAQESSPDSFWEGDAMFRREGHGSKEEGPGDRRAVFMLNREGKNKEKQKGR